MDEIDRQIIAVLRADARATFAEIGDQVGLSAPAAKRRVDRLTATGTISGFTVVADPKALGWGTEAYLEVYCNGKVSPDEWRTRLATIPEVVSAATISGSADALMHILARDVSHLEQTIQRVRGLPHVASTKTEFVLSRLIHREH